MSKSAKNKKIEVDKEYVKRLEEKASLLEEILSFIEDKYLGSSMKKTEQEENIPVSEAKKILK